MIRLAWRNVWRNRRRSALTIASISFGLAAVMVGQSLMKTIQRKMIEKSTGVMSGHIQIQAQDLDDRRVPERLIPRRVKVEEALASDPRVEAVAARILYTGLVYSASGSRGILVAGVEPEGEARISIIPSYIEDGVYFGKDPRGIVIGEKVASDLDVRLGERLVVMAQNKGGEMDSELFRVAGVFRSGSEMYDGQIVYIPLAAAQRIRGEEGRASYLVAKLKDYRLTDAVRAAVAPAARAEGLAAMTYEEVGLEILGIQKFEDAVMAVVLVIIFSIVGLGVMNTISMSFYERLRELGVLRAIGARPASVGWMLVVESLMLGGVGMVAGLLIGWAIISWFGARGLYLPVGQALSYFLPFDPVVHLTPFWAQHLRSAAALLVVAAAASGGPALRACRLKIVEALRHV